MTQGVALITRSTGVAPRAIALRLADDGFDVALSDDADQQSALSQLAREIQSKGVRCESYVCDLLHEESIKDLINGVVRDLGGLDVMVVQPFDVATSYNPITEASLEDWDRAFAGNTRPAFMCFKYAAAQMIKQGRGGRLIVRAAVSVIKAHFPYISAITAANYAIRGLSQAAALELGPHNITVNVVSHSALDDSDDGPYGFKQAWANYNQRLEELNLLKSVQDGRDIVSSRIPLPQKHVTGQEIAQIVSLLASKQNNFMTGQTVAINGGMVML